MSKQKIGKLAFYVLMIISAIVLGIMLTKIKSVISAGEGTDLMTQQYNLLQKQIGIINVVAFIVLLIAAFANYYFTQANNQILMANVFYIAISLFLYVSVNREFYEVQQVNYNEHSGYWLTLFMGVFYVLGGILISAIGFITIRNTFKRKINTDK